MKEHEIISWCWQAGEKRPLGGVGGVQAGPRLGMPAAGSDPDLI